MIDLIDRLVLLKESAIFSRVLTDDLRRIAELMDEQRYFSGERVFDIDEQGDYLYILVSGKIGISIERQTSADKLIDTLTPGDCLGEMNLLDELPRSATAHVLEDSTLLSLDKGRLHGLLLSYPEISVGILRSLSLRLRDAHRRQRETEQSVILS
ncbi:MAG: cyclic nucleotide-binding domain-containing protein [Gammaproteobacteria bacterium]|nr:cyclic nucleotide-binding domain-containing protein [Gammaproteobacteria bacterium]